jgi:DNA-3-methyladenine glycosylase
MSKGFEKLAQPADVVAPLLLGAELVRELDGRMLRGRIVETEAYHQNDAASHSFKGRTPRVDVMFGPPGHLYVYFTYGMHYCCNVVTGQEGEGTGVLIRAIEPLEGEDVMLENRNGRGSHELTNGPAKVCQALRLDRSWNGHDLSTSPLQLVLHEPLRQEDIVISTRVGISQAVDMPWRFYERNNPYVSRL